MLLSHNRLCLKNLRGMRTLFPKTDADILTYLYYAYSLICLPYYTRPHYEMYCLWYSMILAHWWLVFPSFYSFCVAELMVRFWSDLAEKLISVLRHRVVTVVTSGNRWSQMVTSGQRPTWVCLRRAWDGSRGSRRWGWGRRWPPSPRSSSSPPPSSSAQISRSPLDKPGKRELLNSWRAARLDWDRNICWGVSFKKYDQ